jgi:hypothetical protein
MICNQFAKEFKLALIATFFWAIVLSLAAFLKQYTHYAPVIVFMAMPTSFYFGWWLARNKSISKWIDPDGKV